MTHSRPAEPSALQPDPTTCGRSEAPDNDRHRLRALFENALDAILIANDDARYVDANPAACALLGYSRDELLAMTVRDVTPPEYRAAFPEAWAAFLRDGSMSGEYAVFCKDGTTRVVEFRAVANFVPGLHLSSMRDITARKRAEEALRASERRHRELVERAPICIHEIDREGRVTSMNLAGLRMLGVEDEDRVRGRAFLSLVSEEDRERIAGLMAGAFEGRPARFECTSVIDGERKTFASSFIPLTGADGRIERLMRLSDDITECKRAEAALRVSQRLYRLVLDSVDEIIYAVQTPDENPLTGAVQFVSDHVRSILGWEPPQFLEDPGFFGTLVCPDDVAAFEEATRAMFESRRPVVREFRLRHKLTGEYRWMEDRVTPQLDEAGRVIGLFGVARDITVRKRTEEELRVSGEQLRRLSARASQAREEERNRLARELHDELGQVLTGLKMELSWLRRRLPRAAARSAPPLRDKVDQMCALIDSTVRRVRRLSAELRPCALDRLGLLAAIEWQSEQFERQSGIRCRFTSRLKRLDLDRPRSIEVFRILQEALTNVARHAGATRVTVSVKQADRMLVLEVRDNGRGITEPELSDPGSLGLLGMRERALAVGGELQISRIGLKGTSVAVRVPVVR